MCDNIIDAEKSIFRETEIDKYKVIRHKTIDWRLRETGKSGSRKNKYLVSRFEDGYIYADHNTLFAK